MKKYVVVSTNNNPDYIFFAPYIEKAWNSFGWNLCVMITQDVNEADLKLSNPESVVVRLPNIEGLRQESIAQAGRLYAANYLPLDTLLMTSDMDLLPLSDYWHPNENEITVYGHDLTWNTYLPMGYISMIGSDWEKYMNLTGISFNDMNRDSNEYREMVLSPDFERWWNWDWQMITDRMKPHYNKITFINRGQIDIAGATLAKGRIDRYNWDVTQSQPEPFIDAHCHNTSVKNPERFESFLRVFDKFHSKL